MKRQTNTGVFERKMLPHLRAAYSLARWLTSSLPDADYVIREAYLRALCLWGQFGERDARAWLLQIVHTTCFARMRDKFPQSATSPFDEGVHYNDCESQTRQFTATDTFDIHLVRRAIQELPVKYREVLVLRALEDMSCAEVAKITCQTPDTVTSTLFRARRLLRERLRSLVNTRLPAATNAQPSEHR